MTRRPRPGEGRRRTGPELDALLDGGSSGDPRLDRLVSAARGPARPQELSAPAPAVGTDELTDAPSRSRRVLTRLGAATLVTKGIVAGVSAAAVGAAAVAGATHHLPGQTRPHQPVVITPSDSGSRSTPASDAPTSSAPATRSPSTSATPSTSPTPSPGASGAAAIPALCRAWLALPPGAVAERRAPRFVVLIRAAGDEQAVNAYCRTLPTRSPTGTASSSRSPSPTPSAPRTRTPTSTAPRRSATTTGTASPKVSRSTTG